MRKGKSSRLVKGLPMSLGNSTKNNTTTMSKTNLNKKSVKTKMKSRTDVHTNSTDEMTRIPEITTEELRTAINKLKKGEFPDSNGIRAEDFKACDDETKKNKTNLQRNYKAERVHTRGLEESENKSDTQKKKMRKMLETTARSDRCQRCTICSRQYCTAYCIHDLTKYKRMIRRDSEALTKQQIILRRTE